MNTSVHTAVRPVMMVTPYLRHDLHIVRQFTLLLVWTMGRPQPDVASDTASATACTGNPNIVRLLRVSPQTRSYAPSRVLLQPSGNTNTDQRILDVMTDCGPPLCSQTAPTSVGYLTIVVAVSRLYRMWHSTGHSEQQLGKRLSASERLSAPSTNTPKNV
jgi:hypothetical protein